ncbi:MAG TPA: DUF1552 domain-containing protein [Gemmatales bacterium]|nr:DUF1552 domain-containing protein [Gemmatales bacterium]
MALPWLDAMAPSSLLAAPPASRLPVRLAFLYTPNGMHMPAFAPQAEGRQFELTELLETLAPYREQLTVLSGLACDKARANGDGPGDHARAMAAFLTCTQPRKTHGADIRVGVSIDQIIAEKLGGETRLPSLEIGCEPAMLSGNCDSGYSCAYSSTLSWRSPTSPNPKEINPRAVFERLFGAGTPGETAQSRALREQRRRSLLDLVADDARSLARDLGQRDRAKLDEYLTSIRALERRLDHAAKGDGAPDGVVVPDAKPKDYSEHLRLMGDLLVLAFRTDVTRVATFAFANEGSNRPYRFLGVPEGHHDLSHHGNDPQKHEKIKKINRFHFEHFAQIVGQLQSCQEGDGTLLDQTLLVFGSGIGDGNRHNHDNLPIVLAGGFGGKLSPGRHVRYRKETPIANFYLGLLERLGIPQSRFGDSTGRLEI